MNTPKANRYRQGVMNRGAAVVAVCAVMFMAPAAFWESPVRAEQRDAERPDDRPNFVLCMTDDQGWGDTGYNGNKLLKTPVLDEMASSGLRLDRFYAAAPVCSPTRGSVLCGRHPNRYGCFVYNFSFRPEEVTVAEALKRAGYTTGHFGKWHVGPVKAAAPVNPGASGFDQWLSHDNWFDLDPELTRNGRPPRVYPGESSQVVVEAALEFIGQAARTKKPFLAVIWFGSPHGPWKALPEDRQLYRDLSEEEQNYYGEITAMDRAMGQLREGLRNSGVAGNTLLWFCSDNGRVGPGFSGGLRGKKGQLWEGGIRVPGVIEWPAGIKAPFVSDVPCCTSDIYPTLLDIVGVEVPGQPQPLDGISVVGLIERKMTQRPKPIAFWKYPLQLERQNEPYLDAEALTGTWRTFQNYKHPRPKSLAELSGHAALVGNRYKLHKLSGGCELYDIARDPGETHDLASEKPEVVAEMKAALEAWQLSVERSLARQDYTEIQSQ